MTEHRAPEAVTLGCEPNIAESDAMALAETAAGYKDILVVNPRAVTS